jgi:hypothetical protein
MQTVSGVKRLVYRSDGERVEVLVTQSVRAKRIIFTVPDLDEDISGFKGMYDLWADHLARCGVGAVIQIPNRDELGRLKAIPFKKDIEAVCDYASKVALSITSTRKPSLHLLGFSKGGNVKEAIAAKHAAVKRIQSIVPSFSKIPNVLKMLNADMLTFHGELQLSYRENDEIVFSGRGRHFAPWQFEHRA